MKTTDLRGKQLAADAQRLAEIERARLARHARFASDSWIAPRRFEARAIGPPAEVPAPTDEYITDFARRFFH